MYIIKFSEEVAGLNELIKKGLPFNILVWPLCGLYPFTKMYPISVNYGRAPTQMYHGKISM